MKITKTWQANGSGPVFKIIREHRLENSRRPFRVLIQDGKQHAWVMVFKRDRIQIGGRS